MKNILLIVNPCSGQRRARKQLPDIIEIFNRAGYTVITHITACAGDGAAAILRYCTQVDLVVCCGGDGTFNEIISGVLKSGMDIPVGYIPSGSTNDFATSLHLSNDLLQAARDIVDGHVVRLDVGAFGDKFFSYIASFGAFTRTSYTTPQSMKNLLGHTAYVLSGIQELSLLRPYPVRFELGDGTVIEDKFIFGAISNSTSVGGILTLSSDKVDMADGMFELLLIRAPKDLFEVSQCARALQQKNYNCTMITLVNASHLRITAPEEMSWTLDGEHESGCGQIDVRCLHQAIRVCKSK